MLEYNNGETAGVSEAELQANLEVVRTKLRETNENSQAFGYQADEAFLHLPSDTAMLEEVERVASLLRTNALRHVLVVGIGGSGLGAKAAYGALRFSKKQREAQARPNLMFMNTVSGEKNQAILARLEACQTTDEFAVVVVSKSGKTTETITNASFLFDELTNKFGSVASRFACVSDAETPLWKLADEAGFERILIPEKVGGRFSIFSPSGLLPLALGGIDIRALLEGAKEMTQKCLALEGENPALLGAATILSHYKAGRRIQNLFLFDTQLEGMGKWWRQLIGESLGKELDTGGNVVKSGIVPIVSVGSNDLHSVGQLYLALGDGPIFTTFLRVVNDPSMFTVSESGMFTKILPSVSEKTSSDVMKAILDGVETAYRNRHMPYSEITLRDKNEKSVGAFFQLKMIETVLLGKAIGINPFDQPNVEEYKNATRSLLEK